MPRSLAMLLLILALIAFCSAAVALVSFVSAWRRGFGAQSGVTTGTFVVLAIGFILHAGYVLSPLLLAQSRTGLALKLILPIAALASLGILVFLVAASSSLRADAGEGMLGLTWTAWSAVGLLLAYWIPVGALVSQR